MPNWVMNKLTLHGEQSELEKLTEFVKGDADVNAEVFDFNRLIPMPKELLIEEGTRSYNGIRVYLTAVHPDTAYQGIDKLSMEEWEGLKRATKYEHMDDVPLSEEKMAEFMSVNGGVMLRDGIQYVDNLIKYGAINWYHWALKNWGTKWNACDTAINSVDGDICISFETAWDAPEPILVELARRFPNVTIIHQWADECIGNNCGEIVYRNGEQDQDSIYIPDDWQDARSFSCEVWGIEEEEENE